MGNDLREHHCSSGLRQSAKTTTSMAHQQKGLEEADESASWEHRG